MMLPRRGSPSKGQKALIRKDSAMPDLPWTSRSEVEAESEYLVMASHLPLSKISSTVRFFRAVNAIRGQLAHTDGLVGYTLRAKPVAREYWTLSVWKDRNALTEFMRTSPHVGVMTSLKPFMAPTKFIFWSIKGSDGRPDFTDALKRLAAS